MDTKRLLTMMLISFAVIFGWQALMFRIYGPTPRATQQATTAPTTAPTIESPTTIGAPTTGAAPATGPAPIADAASAGPTATQPAAAVIASAAVRVIAPATQSSQATLENGVMTVSIHSAGAGLESATLHDFEAADRKGKYVFQKPYDTVDSARRPLARALATRAITVNGIEVPVADQNWTLQSSDSRTATFVIDLGLVRVRKIYTLPDKTEPGQGFELSMRHEVESTGPAAANVKIAFNGTNVPPSESEQGHDRNILAGYDNGYEAVAITHHLTDESNTKTPTHDITKGKDNIPLLWAGGSSVYFNALVHPQSIDPKTLVPKYLVNVTTEALNPDSKPLDRQVAITFSTAELQVAPNQSLALPASVFLGPRWRKVLNQPPFNQFPRQYDQTLVLTSGPCGFCTFNWLVNGLVGLLNVFHWVFGGFAGKGDWGLAIITLVVLVRALLHPITKRSQISMMKMGKLGPEIERLKKKHGDDKDALNREMMQVYKDQGAGVYLGCLPMFLQMPIWIALWSALNSTFELRQAPFLWGWTWIDDLARPDRLLSWNPVHFWIPLFGEVSISSFNILPVLLGVVFYLQQEFTPKPPATTPEQVTQQKMMKWMTLLFPVFLYNGPSGLNLYILTSTTIGIIESKRIRDHIKQQEELEKAGKVIVDAGMTRKRDDDKSGKGAAKKAAPKKGIAGWLEQMQAKAEEIKRQAEKGRK